MVFKSALLVMLAGASLALASPALADGSHRYVDQTGELAGSADITAVTVTNDDAGRIVFAIALASLPQLPSDTNLYVSIDADQNPGTGDPSGSEYLLTFAGESQTATFSRFTGKAHQVVGSIHPSASYASGTARIGITRADIGTESSFNFYVLSSRGPQATALVDEAPADQSWAYTLQFRPAIRSVVTRFTTGGPRAGKLFSLVSAQVRLDGNRVARATAVRCSAKLAGRTLRPTKAGVCRWRLPAGSRGKRLVVTLTASYRDADTATATRSLTVR